MSEHWPRKDLNVICGTETSYTKIRIEDYHCQVHHPLRRFSPFYIVKTCSHRAKAKAKGVLLSLGANGLFGSSLFHTVFYFYVIIRIFLCVSGDFDTERGPHIPFTGYFYVRTILNFEDPFKLSVSNVSAMSLAISLQLMAYRFFNTPRELLQKWVAAPIAQI